MPFIVSYGSKLRPQVSDRMGFFPDVMPTLCELAGARCPETDGISFLPTLEGREQPQHEYLYWEYPGGDGWIAVRQGKWKGLLRKVKKNNAEFELYDLDADPREDRNVAAQHPEIIERMWEYVTSSHESNPNPLFDMEIPKH